MVLVDKALAPSGRDLEKWEDLAKDTNLLLQKQALTLNGGRDARGRRIRYRVVTAGAAPFIVAVAKTRAEATQDYAALRGEVERQGGRVADWPAFLTDLHRRSSFSAEDTGSSISSDPSREGLRPPAPPRTPSPLPQRPASPVTFATPPLAKPPFRLAGSSFDAAGTTPPPSQREHSKTCAALVSLGSHIIEARCFWASGALTVGNSRPATLSLCLGSLLLFTVGYLAETVALGSMVALAVILKKGRSKTVDEDAAADQATQALRRTATFLDSLGSHSGAMLLFQLLLLLLLGWVAHAWLDLTLLAAAWGYAWLASNRPHVFEVPPLRRRTRKNRGSEDLPDTRNPYCASSPAPTVHHTPQGPAKAAMGCLGALTTVQQEALARLKHQVETKIPQGYAVMRVAPDSLEADRMCLRWLRMNNFNEEKAFKAYQRCVEWREEFHGVGVNHLTPQMCAAELERKKLVYGGRAEGIPVFWLRPHVHFRTETDPKQLELAAVYLMEREVLPRLQSDLLGPAGERVILALDLSQFTRANLDLDGIRQLFTTFQQFYPEHLHSALVIEAPKLFLAAWKMMIRTWLDPATVGKVQFIRREEADQWLPKESIAA